MDRFIHDLNGLVGRDVSAPPGVCGEDADELTKQIYHAVENAGIDYRAVMAGDAPDEVPTWVKNATRVVAKLRRNVPDSTFLRVLKVQTGGKGDELQDPDAWLALTRADDWLDRRSEEAAVDLATCLLDYAFIHQGLVKDSDSKQVVFRQTTSSELAKFQKEDLTLLQEIMGEAKELEQNARREELQKLRAQYQLGRSLKWLGVILCLGAFAFTGKAVFIAMTFVAWLMGHTLMDRKKIALKEKEAKARALPPEPQ